MAPIATVVLLIVTFGAALSIWCYAKGYASGRESQAAYIATLKEGGP